MSPVFVVVILTRNFVFLCFLAWLTIEMIDVICYFGAKSLSINVWCPCVFSEFRLDSTMMHMKC